MKNYPRSLAARLLSLCALLMVLIPSLSAGCTPAKDGGSQPSAPDAKGRYIETQLSLPDGILFPILLELEEGGVPRLLAAEKETFAWYRWENSGFVRTEPAWNSGLKDTYQLAGAAQGEDGKTWLLCAEYQEDETLLPHLFQCSGDSGTLQEIPLEAAGQPCQALDGLQLLEDGGFLIESFPAGLLRYSSEGALLQTYSLSHSGFAAANGSLFLAPYSGPIVELDLETAGEKAQYEYPSDSRSILFTEEGALYAANSNGLFRQEGDGFETVLDGGRYIMSSQNYALALAAKRGEQIALLYTDQTRNYTPALFLYTFDPEAATASRTLKVQSLYDFELVREAASEMQRRDASLSVEVEALLEADAGRTVSDALKTMNTALLAGQGADVYILDGMPLNSLIEKGILLDLTELVAGHTSEGEWLPNIAHSLASESGLFALPVKFGLPILWADPEVLAAGESLETLAAFAQAHPEQPLFYAMHPQNLIGRFFPVCAPGFLQEDGAIEETAFCTFLESLGKLAATAPGAEYQDQGAGMDGSMEVPAYHEGWCRTIAQEVLSDRLLAINRSASEDRGMEGDFIPLPGQAEKVFIPHIITGINAQSSHLEDAKALLETMMEEGIQSIDYSNYEGLPTHAHALDSLITADGSIQMTVGYGLADDNLVIIPVDSRPTPAMQQRFLELCRSAGTPSLSDPVLLEMIAEETESYFAGGQTAAEAAAAVKARTEAYLNE